MKYRLKKDIDALGLSAGDIFDWNKEGYTHEYMENIWIGLPPGLVENNPEWFELAGKDAKDMIADIRDSIQQFLDHLDYIKEKYKKKQ
jgi:hypothetical protein